MATIKNAVLAHLHVREVEGHVSLVAELFRAHREVSERDSAQRRDRRVPRSDV